MAKSKGSTSDAAAVGLTTSQTPCQVRGKELPVAVQVRKGDRLDLFFLVCSSPASLLISIHDRSSTGGKFIFDQEIPPPNPVSIPLILEPGSYVVQWGYIVAGAAWEVVAEVQVNGAAVFRKRNSHVDDRPFNTIFALVEVIP